MVNNVVLVSTIQQSNSVIDKRKRKKEKSLSRVRLVATLWTIAHQAPPSMGFSRQEWQIYMYLFHFKFFSHLGYYRVFSRVPCGYHWSLWSLLVIILNIAVCTCQSQTFNTSLIISHFKSVLEVNRMYVLLMITYKSEKYSLGMVPDPGKQVSYLRCLFSWKSKA